MRGLGPGIAAMLVVGCLATACSRPALAQHAGSQPAGSSPKTQEAARLRAIAAYGQSDGKDFKKFDCHFVEEDSAEWTFFCLDTGEKPRPGSQNVVRVNKATGSVEVLPGR